MDELKKKIFLRYACGNVPERIVENNNHAPIKNVIEKSPLMICKGTDVLLEQHCKR